MLIYDSIDIIDTSATLRNKKNTLVKAQSFFTPSLFI